MEEGGIMEACRKENILDEFPDGSKFVTDNKAIDIRVGFEIVIN